MDKRKVNKTLRFITHSNLHFKRIMTTYKKQIISIEFAREQKNIIFHFPILNQCKHRKSVLDDNARLCSPITHSIFQESKTQLSLEEWEIQSFHFFFYFSSQLEKSQRVLKYLSRPTRENSVCASGPPLH